MIVVLTGAPGAGKGTQAELLAQRNGFEKISTGDLLRRHAKKRTTIGKKVDSLLSEGRLVPDEILTNLIEDGLKLKTRRDLLLDGYPRNLFQVRELEKITKGNPISSVVHLDVERDELVRRLTSRRICNSCAAIYNAIDNPPKVKGRCDWCDCDLIRRADDVEDKIEVRLDIYERETARILDFYRQEGKLSIVDGNGKAEAVYNHLKGIIGEG